ncbi:hypothetical protein F2Q68_00025775 [Brassica cretica]|uniref:Dirigent protein n=1 Tax=Brassica cretica TaxID=69181 RepID=A0A8S9I6U8_BRACR|nr:hypothetical protein F2Q68_00025775 [Brassica cretica]
MKRNFWLVALFLVLSFVISSYAASTHPFHIRRLFVYAHAIVNQATGATIDSKANAGDKQHERGRLCRIAPIRHLLSVLSSSVQDGVDVRSRPPVLVPLRRVSSTSASPHLKPMTAPSRVVLSTFVVVGIKPHCRVSDPLLPVCHRRQRDPTKR